MTKEQKSVQVSLSAKAVSEKEKTVRAVVTAPTLDRDYDVVDTASLRLPLKGGGNVQAKALTGTENLDVPFLLNHSMDVEDVIGSARSANMNAQGELEMVFGLSSLQKAQNMFTLLSEGHLDNAFSITFHDYEVENGVMKDAEVLEVSLVWRGSNKDAKLLEVSKMLTVDKEVDTDKEETVVEEATTESVEAEENTNETETQTEETVETETNNNDESDVAADTAETDESDKETNKEIKMTENEKNVATEAVVEKAEAVQTKAVAKVSGNTIRKNFVDQLRAVYNKDEAGLMKAAGRGAELENVESKVLDGSHIYLAEVVANDIKAAYVDAGGVGSLVNRIDVTGADIFKQVVETSGVGFQPVALGGVKPEDAPVWTQVDIEPLEWALIVVWRDGQAARSPIAVYQQIVRYIADEYKKLEDKVILAYEGGTVGSESRDATGLVPLLEDASRSSAIATYDAENLYPALAEAFGEIESDAPLSIVANRKTWAQIATSLDNDGNTVFKVTGKTVSAGALGAFNVVTSEVLEDGAVVVGAFRDYTLVTRGSVATLFSQEATVGSTNLFTQNASGLRASIDIAGAATPITSFWLLTAAGYVS